jgi:hypothetical protein
MLLPSFREAKCGWADQSRSFGIGEGTLQATVAPMYLRLVYRIRDCRYFGFGLINP